MSERALPHPLLPSIDLIGRTLQAEASYTLARLQVLERLPGNPIGVACRQVEGGAVALMAQNLPSPSFNSVVGLRAGQARHVEELVAWYREHGVAGRFEVVPGFCDAEVCRELSRLGYFQSGFHVSVIGAPDLPVGEAGGIAVETVTDAGLMEEFLDAYVAGWGVAERDHDRFKGNVRPWREQAGWTLYVARHAGRAAATAILFVERGVAYLADASTDPACRGCGLHGALLRRRIADAAAAGVDFVCSGAAYLSASHRNMERAGMRIQFVRAIWTPL